MTRQVRLEAGQFHFYDVNVHDDSVVDCCNTDWMLAARIVAEIPIRHGLNDIFVNGRLHLLLGQKRIETDGPPTDLRAYKVRRTAGA